MNRSTRVATNTIASYARLAISAAVGFVTVPMILRSVGAVDYGIFSVIGGSLSFLTFINGALAAGAHRHMAYSIGEQRLDEAREWFNGSLYVHLLLALALSVAALLMSDLMTAHFLSIPRDRLTAALWSYRLVVLALAVTVISTPYHALLMAKESMVSLSLCTIASSILLLVCVMCLRFVRSDVLIWYSGAYVLSQLVLLIGSAAYCMLTCPECGFIAPSSISRKKIRELLAFSGWSLFGNLSVQARFQGPAVLINRFFGTVANAAYGIALQVNNFALNISGAVLRATSPAIVKCEAAGDRGTMLLISNLSSKYAFVLLWLAVGPILWSFDFCLRIWLHQVPPGTDTFATLLLIALLIDQLTSGFVAAVQAEGRIGWYQLFVSVPMFLSIGVGYSFFSRLMPASSVLWAGVGAVIVSGAVRLIFVSKMLGHNYSDWLREVVFPSLMVCIISCCALWLIASAWAPGLVRLAAMYLANAMIIALVGWTCATSEQERYQYKSHVASWRAKLQVALGSLS